VADTLPDPSTPPAAGPAAKVARIFGFLAERDFRGFSPLYAYLGHRIAADERIPALVTGANQRNHAPILFFACVNDLVLRHPDCELAACYTAVAAGADPATTGVWPALQALVAANADELDAMLRTRQVQTNEVGRSAAVRAGLAALGRDLVDGGDATSRPVGGRATGRGDWPVGIIELGCSAGLNLFFDQFAVDYGPGIATVGPPDATVRLDCELRGPGRPPLDLGTLDIRARAGIERSPVDLDDDDAIRWLRACIWPDMTARIARFDAAVELARAAPPQVLAGDLVERLDDAVRLLPSDVAIVLFSTWVFGYVPRERLVDLQGRIEALAADRPVAVLSADYELTVPWVDPAPRLRTVPSTDVPTQLALARWDPGWSGGQEVRQVTLAWMHSHGAWMEWLDEGEATGPDRHRA